jgi:hypothetical protein
MSRKSCPACTVENDENSKDSMCDLSLGNSIDEASTEKRKIVQSNDNKKGFPFEGFIFKFEKIYFIQEK